MDRPASSGSSPSSGSAALLACALLAAALPAPARPCSGDGPEIGDLTTFAPHVLGEPAVEGQLFDPFREGYEAPCDGCERKELLADWAAYLPEVRAEDWAKVLFDADLPILDGLILFLQGKQPAAPRGWGQTSLAALSRETRKKVVPALFLVGFARRVEPFATARSSEGWSDDPRNGDRAASRPGPDGAAVLRSGDRALVRARDPFLRQRYAFLLLRLRFHLGDWPDVVAFHAAYAAALEGPSAALRWRARYYLAGAFWRMKRLALANLELARVHAAAPSLAGRALRDFEPMEEKDWQATLALAGTVREKAQLWQMVGIKRDALAAMSAIAAVDPGSRLIALLAVREINRVEFRRESPVAIERLAGALAEAPQTDRPWLLDLVAAHAAALRGDLAATRARLERALRGSPQGADLVRAQARATLSLALARAWRPGEAALGDELARTLAEAVPPAPQLTTARLRVRAILAAACSAAGLREEAELLAPTTGPTRWDWPSSAARQWQDPRFVEALIDRVSSPKTALDRFMAQESGYTREKLERELARVHLARGDFAGAHRLLAKLPDELLGTRPFAMHVIDCHDCDQRDGGEPWTAERLAAALVEKERAAQGKGEAAARAAYEVASAEYNLTFAGNARVVLGGTHAATGDTRAAERWFARALELTADRELKARAATMAAKCELAREEGNVARTWYPVLATLSDTAYHAEVLAECGWYRDWTRSP